MAEFLLELFSEEIPARMQQKAADDLKRLVTDVLKAAGVGHGPARAYATPRRLALVIEDLPLAQGDMTEERRGPRADAPPQAIDGFLKSTGLSRDQLEERAEAKGTFLYALIKKEGQPTADLLAAAIPDIIRNFPWAKAQRWGAGTLRWVRPLHTIVALLDGEVVPVAIDGIVAGAATRGHRFLSPSQFRVTGFADYQEKLKLNFVILDAAARKDTILKGARKLASEAGLELIEDDRLADEVAGLVEWPVPLLGAFDQSFMDVPEECLISEMREHQKYFALRTPEGALSNKFVITANIETADEGAKIIAGNQRVLASRLSDAKFFWDQDQKVKLADRADKLQSIVFHQKLGTVAEKVERVAKLAADLAAFIPGCDAEKAKEAARLMKCDLVTGMVGEFPELQGVMGRYYALKEGMDPAIADAIRDHYSPVGPTDACPTAPVSVAVALADKLDTLTGFFAIDEKPTGSKDPFALRRAALGVIRLVTENGLRMDLREALLVAIGLFPEHCQSNAVEQDGGTRKTLGETWYAERRISGITAQRLEVVAELLDFFADRLKVQQREKGVRHDLIDAVFSLGGESDLVRLLSRVSALSAFLGTDDGANLLAGYKRAANILKIEEKKDGAAVEGAADAAALVEPEERALHAALADAAGPIATALKAEDFGAAMSALAKLRQPIDAFFDKVLVNDPVHRANRLKLLKAITTAAGQIADFSRIEG